MLMMLQPGPAGFFRQGMVPHSPLAVLNGSTRRRELQNLSLRDDKSKVMGISVLCPVCLLFLGTGCACLLPPLPQQEGSRQQNRCVLRLFLCRAKPKLAEKPETQRDLD